MSRKRERGREGGRAGGRGREEGQQEGRVEEGEKRREGNPTAHKRLVLHNITD